MVPAIQLIVGELWVIKNEHSYIYIWTFISAGNFLWKLPLKRHSCHVVSEQWDSYNIYKPIAYKLPN